MAEPIKNMITPALLSKIATDIQLVYAPFQVDAFLQAVFDETWEALELTDRIYRVSLTLGQYLSEDYGEAIGIIDKVVMNYGSWLNGTGFFFPPFVELYGQDEKN